MKGIAQSAALAYWSNNYRRIETACLLQTMYDQPEGRYVIIDDAEKQSEEAGIVAAPRVPSTRDKSYILHNTRVEDIAIEIRRYNQSPRDTMYEVKYRERGGWDNYFRGPNGVSKLLWIGRTDLKVWVRDTLVLHGYTEEFHPGEWCRIILSRMKEVWGTLKEEHDERERLRTLPYDQIRKESEDAE